MRGLCLFSGIGGAHKAASWAGIQTQSFCEIEKYPVSILNKRYPNIPVLPDVREVKGEIFNGKVEVIYGGSPCQDLSVAGNREGLDGERSKLWFEMLRIISEARPYFTIVENVRGAVNLALDTMRMGLEGEDYEVRPYVISASSVGAPHKRERLFIVGIRKDVANILYKKLQGYELNKWNDTQGWQNKNGSASQCDEDRVKLWPTPSVCGNYNRKGASKTSGDGLATAVNKLWPTPCANKISGYRSEGYGKCLPQAVNEQIKEGKLWPTPREFMYKDSVIDRGKSNIGEVVGGPLNPDWVEILMGLPIGYTDIDCEKPQKWEGFPAPMGHEQYEYEPPRTITMGKNRTNRLKVLGNMVVPQQIYPFMLGVKTLYDIYLETKCS